MKTLGTLLILLALGIVFFFYLIGVGEHRQRTSDILWDHRMAMSSIADDARATNHELPEEDKRKRRYGLSTPIDYSKLPLREPTQSELDGLESRRVSAARSRDYDLKKLDAEYSPLDVFIKNKTAVTASLVFFFVGAILIAVGGEMKKLRPANPHAIR